VPCGGPETVTGTGGKKLLILYLVFAATISHKIQITIHDDSLDDEIKTGCP
jgi:hypothetical protein